MFEWRGEWGILQALNPTRCGVNAVTTMTPGDVAFSQSSGDNLIEVYSCFGLKKPQFLRPTMLQKTVWMARSMGGKCPPFASSRKLRVTRRKDRAGCRSVTKFERSQLKIVERSRSLDLYSFFFINSCIR